MIFCVEDDAAIRDLMIYALGTAGFQAEGFADGAALTAGLRCCRPELIMLDIMLPGEDGVAILRRLKSQENTRDIPVIMASAKGTEYDKVIGLDLGADDYLAKPFGMMEMVSRIRAVLRRAAPETASACLSLGRLKMDTASHTVQSDGADVLLTRKEYALLKLFLSAPGIVFTREHLLEQIWGTDFLGESRTVDVHIGTLRTKLGICGDYIRTVRGVGYRLEVSQ